MVAIMPSMARRHDLAHLLRNPGNVTARDLIRAAEDRGWERDRTRGSHHTYVKGERGIQIPDPVKGIGTIRKIIRDLMEEENDGGSASRS
jgi:predicted RNA binding protein YcfA (HicA-like mRNA interferase family)